MPTPAFLLPLHIQHLLGDAEITFNPAQQVWPKITIHGGRLWLPALQPNNNDGGNVIIIVLTLQPRSTTVYVKVKDAPQLKQKLPKKIILSSYLAVS